MFAAVLGMLLTVGSYDATVGLLPLHVQQMVGTNH
jgi:hypothetical protein